MKALIVGATGATGKDLLNCLLADERYTQVEIFVRRAVNIEHDKLTVHVIDFNQPESWQDKVRGDVLFSCLGTTLKDAGSQDAQWKIDYDYQLEFAKAAKANGVGSYVLVSASGANRNAQFFYPRMKGLLEESVRALDFPHLMIFRPPMLARQGSNRSVEVQGIKVINWLNQRGLFKSQRPLPTADLAHAMAEAAAKPHVLAIYLPQDIWAMVSHK